MTRGWPCCVGIHQEIIQALPTVKPWRIRQTIAFFQCGREGAYWRAVRKGGPRYTLDGTPKGEVTGKEQAHAREQLAALRAWRKAQRPTRLGPETASHGAAAAPEAGQETVQSMWQRQSQTLQPRFGL